MVSVTVLLSVKLFSYVLAVGFMLTVTGISALDRLKRVNSEIDVKPHSRPWMALLEVGSKQCGAFLVNLGQAAGNYSDILLTAAHCLKRCSRKDCLYGFPSSPPMWISFGRHHKNWKKRDGPSVRVLKYISHNDSKVGHHDITMLKLERPVEFNSIVQPIALANSLLRGDENCSFCGWGGTNTLKTVSYDRVEYNYTSGNYQTKDYTIPGDSGSPLICEDRGSYVAHGLLSSAINQTSFFIDIVSHLPWIFASYKEINDPHFYNPQLREFQRSMIGPEFSIEQLLLHYFTVLFELVPDGYYRDLKIGMLDHASFLDRSFHRNFYIVYNMFYMHDIAGYAKVDDAHLCAVLCFNGNFTGPCSFVPSVKRCYVSNSHSRHDSISMPHGQSILIRIPRKEKGAAARGLNVKPKRVPSILGKMINFSQPPLWSISIRKIKTASMFHCTGQMMFDDNVSWIVASSTCLSRLTSVKDGMTTHVQVSIVKNGSIFESNGVFTMNSSAPVTQIYDASVVSTHTDYHTNNTDYEFCEGTNGSSRVSFEVPRTNSTMTEYPQLIKYDPNTGSFISEPYSLPWLVDIGQNNYNSRCMGVLLNESALTGAGRKDRTRFVLTSRRCIRENTYAGKTYIRAGVYYRRVNSQFSQSQEVVSLHEHPDFEGDWNITTNLEELFTRHPDLEQDWKMWMYENQTNQNPLYNWIMNAEGPQILELADDIFFNAHIKPLSLVTDQPVLFDDTGLFTVNWDQVLYNNKPQYITPLSTNLTNKVNIRKNIKTKRLFYYGHGLDESYSDGAPLIYCDIQKMENECQLLGIRQYSSYLKSNGEEDHLSISPYVEWIRETIAKVIQMTNLTSSVV